MGKIVKNLEGAENMEKLILYFILGEWEISKANGKNVNEEYPYLDNALESAVIRQEDISMAISQNLYAVTSIGVDWGKRGSSDVEGTKQIIQQIETDVAKNYLMRQEKNPEKKFLHRVDIMQKTKFLNFKIII